MDESKQILKHCPYFDNIVNCDFLEDDLLTIKLIQYYQDYIFNVDINLNKDITLVKKLDKAIYKYINNYQFAKKLKDTLDVEMIIEDDFSYFKQLMEYIINFYDDYQEENNHIETEWI